MAHDGHLHDPVCRGVRDRHLLVLRAALRLPAVLAAVPAAVLAALFVAVATLNQTYCDANVDALSCAFCTTDCAAHHNPIVGHAQRAALNGRDVNDTERTTLCLAVCVAVYGSLYSTDRQPNGATDNDAEHAALCSALDRLPERESVVGDNSVSYEATDGSPQRTALHSSATGAD